MSKRKIVSVFSVALLSFSLIFSPIDFSYFLDIPFAQGEVLSSEDSNGDIYEEWSGLETVSGYRSIDYDVTVTVKPGTIIEFEGQATLEVSGTLLIEGTPSDPVILRKKNPDNSDESYSVTSFGTVRARNIDVSGGGIASEVFMVEGKSRSLLNRAQAFWMYNGAFGAQSGGVLDIEGANFHDNALAIYTDRSSASQVKVWRSQFSGNNLDFVNSGGSSPSRLQYNWWGSEDGPILSFSEQEYPRMYERIIGNVSVAPWATASDMRDPVIVVPGIMGSWKKTQASELEFDPILGTYENLIETLDENGYEEGKDLFRFPYEWRSGNAMTAALLQSKINEIKTQANWPRVDIVAHSMGGLVAREYIQTLNGDANVDQLITLGTPHNGAPRSYLQWEGGEFGIKLRDNLLEFIFQQEAEENGYGSVFDYIRKAPIPSVRELLPTYPYLRNVSETELMTYASPQYPRNVFLENLKTLAAMRKLSDVSFTNIAGKTADDSTIEKIRVNDSSIELINDPEAIVLWGHGKPDGYDDFIGGDRGLELGPGDGTVPLNSAKDIASDELIELASGHDDLPSDAAEIVYKTLTGSETSASIIKKSQPASILLVMPFSPVDIQVVSPSGLKIGKDFESDGFLNEIPGAYYTGSDTKNEFVTIPNPEDGEYKILARGTDGGGTYRIEATKIVETAGGDATESTATIEGEAVAGAMEEDMAVEVSANAVELKDERDIVAPTVTIASPEQKIYQNDGIIPVSYAVADDVSLEASLSVTVSLDGESYVKSDIDSSLLPLGAHTLSVSATDETGNVGTMDANFTLETSWGALSKNIDHYASLGLLKNKGERQMLKSNIRNLDNMVGFLEKYDIFFRLHPKLWDIFERQIAHQISILQKYVKQKSGRSIDPIAAERLIESMEALKKGVGA